MKGSLISNETELNAPAAEVWAVYSTERMMETCVEDLPNIIPAYQVIGGSYEKGDVVLRVSVAPEAPGPGYFVEKVSIDHETRVKKSDIIEGAYIALGYKTYFVYFQVVEKPAADDGSPRCVVKTSVEYDSGESDVDQAAILAPDVFAAIAAAIGKRVTEQLHVRSDQGERHKHTSKREDTVPNTAGNHTSHIFNPKTHH